ncbi:hypothetical protein QC760_001187 [Botrytis cinerea]
MGSRLPIRNLPFGDDGTSAPVQKSQETIHSLVEYRIQSKFESSSAGESTIESEVHDTNLYITVSLWVADVQSAVTEWEMLNGHGSGKYAAQSPREKIEDWISHVQSESENFTKYEYDMNEDTKNRDTTLNGYAVNASLPYPVERFESKEEVDNRIQSVIDFIFHAIDPLAFFATLPTSDSGIDEGYKREIDNDES